MTIAMAGSVTIDGQTYSVIDVERVAPEYERFEANVPDEQWHAEDANGHEHRYWWRSPSRTGDPELPTLERCTRHIDCDGTGLHAEDFCTGWDEPYWVCTRCGDEVRPGQRRGTVSMERSPSYWRVTSSCDPADLADENGRIVLSPMDGVRNVPGRLVWPAGPGQMLDISGRVWTEQSTKIESRGPLGGVATQVWRLLPDGAL